MTREQHIKNLKEEAENLNRQYKRLSGFNKMYSKKGRLASSLQWAIKQLEKPTPALLTDEEIADKCTYQLHKPGWHKSLPVVDEKQYEAAKWARDKMMEAFEPIVKEAYAKGLIEVGVPEGRAKELASEYWERLKERLSHG
jgi:hypothetical protein